MQWSHFQSKEWHEIPEFVGEKFHLSIHGKVSASSSRGVHDVSLFYTNPKLFEKEIETVSYICFTWRKISILLY